MRNSYGEPIMDKDRIEGIVKHTGGALKEGLGKIFGDAKLQGEGAAEKAEGSVQNAVGSIKDSARDAMKP